MDHLSIGDKDVQEITEKGIRYSGGFIDLADCAARFFRENGGSGQCVGECCAQGRLPYLAFYTQSLITRIVFQSESRVKELLHKKTPAFQRLRAMRDKLTELGYTLYDIT